MTQANVLAQLGSTSGPTFRNRIINGAMVIDQRNVGASVTMTNTSAIQYTLDRWYGYGSVASKFSIQQDAAAVTPPVGFNDYLGATSLSAYSISSSDIFIIGQSVEGYNVADLMWGTSNAKTVTLSFWVRSSLTGTFGASVINSAQNRTYPFTYTINSANTWEYETITIAGDTSGTWLTTSGIGLKIYWGLGVGSTYSGTAGAWASGSYFGATGATSVVGTNGATFYITGVQLEVGSSATGYEYRQYQQELALCQRYYEKIGLVLVTNIPANYPAAYWSVSKRAVPTITTTPQGGAGAGVVPFVTGYGELSGCYQSVGHSGDSNSLITGSAEL